MAWRKAVFVFLALFPAAVLAQDSPGTTPVSWVSILPILMLILGVMGGLYITGRTGPESDSASVKEIIGSADSYKSLMGGSTIGMTTAALLTLAQRILSLEELVNAWYKGLRVAGKPPPQPPG